MSRVDTDVAAAFATPYSHRGTRAIQRMVEFAPSTGGLALWVRHCDREPETGAMPIWTDGTTIFYGAGFSKLPLAQQVGLVAHEVLHVAFRHPQRFLELQGLTGDADLHLFNVCADAIINSTLAHLSWLELPRTAVMLDRLLHRVLGISQEVEKSLLEWDVERLYRALDDRRAAGGRENPRRNHGSTNSDASEDGPKAAQARLLANEMPADLVPGPDTQGPPETEAALCLGWSERILRAHAGDGAHSMLRTLIADLPRVQTPWEQVLRTQLARKLTPKPGVSWSRPARSYIANQGRAGPHRRLPWTPGISASKYVAHLVVIVDVSGSIEDKLMERFAREIEAITRRLEAGLILVIGDDRVRDVRHFEPGESDLRQIEFDGGGGTDFTPLLEEANRHRPDIAVVLTDLDGPVRFCPRWPLVWAVPASHASAVAPFGRLLILN
jgi:predicted metal-dependent peptidase